jgi:hypothetical protein
LPDATSQADGSCGSPLLHDETSQKLIVPTTPRRTYLPIHRVSAWNEMSSSVSSSSSMLL